MLSCSNSIILWHISDSVGFGVDWDREFDLDSAYILGVPDVVQEGEIQFLVDGGGEGDFGDVNIVLFLVVGECGEEESVDFIVVGIAR